MNRVLSISLIFAALFLRADVARAAEVIPPTPPRYFNDYARVVSPSTAQNLNAKLSQFDKESSTQILVAIYPRMQTDSSIEDYTVRIAQKWAVGGKKYDNGAILFVFTADRKMYMQVGYGLEGALPDATAKSIIENEIKPAFQRGDFDGGLTKAVDAMIAATKGEYTAPPRQQSKPTARQIILLIFVIVVVLWIVASAQRGPITYTRRGRYDGGIPPIIFGGGGWGGGGSRGGGGGGFSAGGGSFGGGGAGGSW